MADGVVRPGAIRGELAAPPSKSAAHRALICAALARGESLVSPIAPSEDMAATLQVLAAIGVRVQPCGEGILVDGGACSQQPAVLDCGESGSTLRFLLPVAAALGVPATFTGHGRLPQRPIGVLAQQMQEHGVSFSGFQMPFTIQGQLTPGEFLLPGDVSSQFVTGLLFALPLLEGDSWIRLTSPLQSAGYVQMTLDALSGSGVQVTALENGWHIPGGQHYLACPHKVEGDWSNAAFWLCAGVIGGGVRVTGLRNDSLQGDREILALLERFGAQVCQDAHAVCVQSAPLRGIAIDAGPIPDLVPILAVTAAFAQGETEIYNAARLRLKESDRLASTAALVNSLGGRAEEFPDRLVIHGGGLTGGTVDGAGDHRIVMSAAIAGLHCRQPVTIRGIQAVNKSYPDFFSKLSGLGGNFHAIHLG